MATKSYDIWVLDENGNRVRNTITEAVAEVFSASQIVHNLLRDRLINNLNVNSNFLAITNPTNAQLTAHVKLLTRENNALIRILLGILDTAEGT